MKPWELKLQQDGLILYDGHSYSKCKVLKRKHKGVYTRAYKRSPTQEDKKKEIFNMKRFPT